MFRAANAGAQPRRGRSEATRATSAGTSCWAAHALELGLHMFPNGKQLLLAVPMISTVHNRQALLKVRNNLCVSLRRKVSVERDVDDPAGLRRPASIDPHKAITPDMQAQPSGPRLRSPYHHIEPFTPIVQFTRDRKVLCVVRQGFTAGYKCSTYRFQQAGFEQRFGLGTAHSSDAQHVFDRIRAV